MRPELLYNPRLLCERLAEISRERRRLAKLRGTVAAQLERGHVDSLELLESLRPLNPRVIYDIGAHIGTWTLLARAIFPEAEIHAFEPLQQHAAALEKNLASLSRVRRHAVALGESAGHAVLHVTKASDSSSLLPISPDFPKEWWQAEVEQSPVGVARLDDYRRQQQMPLPNLIKLDVQGFELAVLRGATECLKSADAVLAEVSFQEIYQGQCLFHEVAAFLSGHGFVVYALGHGTVIDRPILQTDALFLKQDKLSAVTASQSFL